MAKAPEALVIIRLVPREPTIVEMMTIVNFFMRYGGRFSPGANLINYQLTDMPEMVNDYWFWMHVRTWD